MAREAVVQTPAKPAASLRIAPELAALSVSQPRHAALALGQAGGMKRKGPSSALKNPHRDFLPEGAKLQDSLADPEGRLGHIFDGTTAVSDVRHRMPDDPVGDVQRAARSTARLCDYRVPKRRIHAAAAEFLKYARKTPTWDPVKINLDNRIRLKLRTWKIKFSGNTRATSMDVYGYPYKAGRKWQVDIALTRDEDGRTERASVLRRMPLSDFRSLVLNDFRDSLQLGQHILMPVAGGAWGLGSKILGFNEITGKFADKVMMRGPSGGVQTAGYDAVLFWNAFFEPEEIASIQDAIRAGIKGAVLFFENPDDHTQSGLYFVIEEIPDQPVSDSPGRYWSDQGTLAELRRLRSDKRTIVYRPRSRQHRFRPAAAVAPGTARFSRKVAKTAGLGDVGPTLIVSDSADTHTLVHETVHLVDEDSGALKKVAGGLNRLIARRVIDQDERGEAALVFTFISEHRALAREYESRIKSSAESGLVALNSHTAHLIRWSYGGDRLGGLLAALSANHPAEYRQVVAMLRRYAPDISGPLSLRHLFPAHF